MRAFGARGGCIGPNQKKKLNALLRAVRRDKRQRERALIAALSNQDIQKIMARVIGERIAAAQAVTVRDFTQNGIPEHRIEKNRDAAMRLARRINPRLDAMMAMPCAA